MSQPDSNTTNKDCQPNQAPNQATKPKGSSTRTAGIIGLALVAILALGFAGYTALNPHVSTVTQQQLVTNTQSVYNTQTQTITSVAQVTQIQTVANNQAVTVAGQGAQGYAQYCSAYGCMSPPASIYNTYNPSQPPNPWVPGYYQGAYYGYYNGNFVPPCNAQGASNNTVTCSGYIFTAQNGCTVLVIPVANPFYSESISYQYYTLHNLPSNVPSSGSWTTVTGQLYNGANTSTSGASCPGNYINVSSVS